MKHFEEVNAIELKKSYSGIYGTVSLKLDNLVSEITMVNRNSGDETEITSYGNFKPLIDANVELDFSEIIAKFNESVKEFREKEELLKIEKLRNYYKKSMLWEIIEICKTQFPDIEVSFISEEEFIKRANFHFAVTLKYKERSIQVGVEDRKFVYYAWKSYRPLSYKNAKSLVQKFIKKVDDEEVEAEAAKKRKEESKNTHEKNRSELEKICGAPVEIVETGKLRNWGPKNDRFFKVTTYELKLNGRSISISFHYNDKTLFNFAGLSKITKEQLLSIIELLK